MSNAPEQTCVLSTILKWTFGIVQSKNVYAIRKLFKLNAWFLSIFFLIFLRHTRTYRAMTLAPRRWFPMQYSLLIWAVLLSFYRYTSSWERVLACVKPDTISPAHMKTSWLHKLEELSVIFAYKDEKINSIQLKYVLKEINQRSICVFLCQALTI